MQAASTTPHHPLNSPPYIPRIFSVSFQDEFFEQYIARGGWFRVQESHRGLHPHPHSRNPRRKRRRTLPPMRVHRGLRVHVPIHAGMYLGMGMLGNDLATMCVCMCGGMCVCMCVYACMCVCMYICIFMVWMTDIHAWLVCNCILSRRSSARE